MRAHMVRVEIVDMLSREPRVRKYVLITAIVSATCMVLLVVLASAMNLCLALFDAYIAHTHVPWQDVESEALGPLVLFSLFLNLSWAISRKDDRDYVVVIGTFLAKTISCCIEWSQQLSLRDCFIQAQKCLKIPASNTTC
jgi:hypothetical protein